MTDKITIQIATPKDILGIRNVSKTTWTCTFPNKEYGITREDIEARFTFQSEESKQKYIETNTNAISDPNQHYWVAKTNDTVVGFCIAKKRDARNVLQALHVLPDHQGKGIGKELMQTALDWIGNEKDIELSVAEYNDKAIAFYEKFGFKKTGQSVDNEVSVLPSGKVIPQIEMIKKFI